MSAWSPPRGRETTEFRASVAAAGVRGPSAEEAAGVAEAASSGAWPPAGAPGALALQTPKAFSFLPRGLGGSRLAAGWDSSARLLWLASAGSWSSPSVAARLQGSSAEGSSNSCFLFAGASPGAAPGASELGAARLKLGRKEVRSLTASFCADAASGLAAKVALGVRGSSFGDCERRSSARRLSTRRLSCATGAVGASGSAPPSVVRVLHFRATVDWRGGLAQSARSERSICSSFSPQLAPSSSFAHASRHTSHGRGASPKARRASLSAATARSVGASRHE
mmetsp:Transcript_345/g.1158  ORF Transcript_345/g.1158 Transcript_345/m.1158 type:complete len:281 (-) Transcript_345:112-954(-)